MRFHKLRKAALILGVSTPLVLIAACEKSGFTRSTGKKSTDRNTQNQTSTAQGNSPYGYSNGGPNSTAYGNANGTGPNSPSNVGTNNFGNNGVSPNGFNNPGGITGGSNPFNPLGFPGAPGGLNGFGGDTPLILDWDRDGLISMNSNAVAFDINGDGMRDRTEWVSSSERILALDLNRNGMIDSGKELFGSATVDPSTFRNYQQGFQALAAYDDNKDGKIDRQDPVFEKLVLWQDKNGNGVSEAGELSRITDSDVIALNSLYKTLPMGGGMIRGSRSRIGFESVYETGEGMHLLADVIFYNERNAADLTAALSVSEVR